MSYKIAVLTVLLDKFLEVKDDLDEQNNAKMK